MTVVSDLVATLRLDYADFNSGLNAASGSLSSFGSIAAGVTTGQIALGAAVGDVAVAIGQTLVASLQTAGAMMYQFNNLQQDLKVRFDTLTQSDFFGSAFTNSVIDFANQYGLKLQDVGQAAVQLLNVMGPMASTPQIWLDLADAAEISGKQMSVLSDQLVKISQLLSSGGTSLVGPGMISRQLLGEGLTEAQIQQVTAMGKAGASAQEIFQTLATMLEDKFAGAAAAAADNTQHLVSSIEQLAATDMTKAFEPAVKGIDSLLEGVKTWLSSTQGQNFFKDIQEDAKNFVTFIEPLAKAFGDLVVTIGQVAQQIGNILSPLAAVVPLVVQLTTAIVEFVAQHPAIIQVVAALLALEGVNTAINLAVAAFAGLQGVVTGLIGVFTGSAAAQQAEAEAMMADAVATSQLVAAKAALAEAEIMVTTYNTVETSAEFENALAVRNAAAADLERVVALQGETAGLAEATTGVTGFSAALSVAIPLLGLLTAAMVLNHMNASLMSSVHKQAANDVKDYMNSLAGEDTGQKIADVQAHIKELSDQAYMNPMSKNLGARGAADEIQILKSTLSDLVAQQKEEQAAALNNAAAMAQYAASVPNASNVTNTLTQQLAQLTAQQKDLQATDRVIKNQEAQAQAADRVAVASINLKDAQAQVNDSITAFNQIMGTGEADPYLRTLTSIEKLTPAQAALGDEFKAQVAIYDQLNTELDGITDHYNALNATMTQMNDQIKIQEDSYQGINNQYQNLSDQLAIVNDKIKQQEELWTPALTANQRAQDAIKLQIDQLLAAGHFDKEPAIITLKNQLAVLQNQADQMKLKETLSTPIVDLQNQAQTLTSNMDNLKPSIDANKMSLDAAKQSTQSVQDQMDLLKPSMDAVKTELDAQKQKTDALNTALTSLVSADGSVQSATKALYDAMKSQADAARQAVIDDNNAMIQSLKDLQTAVQTAGGAVSGGGGGTETGGSVGGITGGGITGGAFAAAAGIGAAQAMGVSPVDSYAGGAQDNPQANFSTAMSMAAAKGWTGAEWTALANLWIKESGFQTFAKNASSGAYGIPQSLPADKMASFGSDYLSNPATQIAWGLDYIKGRYGDPVSAWQHEVQYNWYDNGGWLPPGMSTVVNNTGVPEPVLTPDQWNAMRNGNGIVIAPGAIQIAVTSDAVSPHDVQVIVENAFSQLLDQIRVRG